MGDHPLAELGRRTPLQAAKTPNLDFLARNGELGLVKTTPDGFYPGGDVTQLAILGYDPGSTTQALRRWKRPASASR